MIYDITIKELNEKGVLIRSEGISGFNLIELIGKFILEILPKYKEVK